MDEPTEANFCSFYTLLDSISNVRMCNIQPFCMMTICIHIFLLGNTDLCTETYQNCNTASNNVM